MSGGGGDDALFPFDPPDLPESNFWAPPLPEPRGQNGASATAPYDVPHQQVSRTGSGGGGTGFAKAASLPLGIGRPDTDMDAYMDMDLDLDLELDMDVGVGMGMGMQQPGIAEGCGGGAWTWHDRYPGVLPVTWDHC